MGNKHALQLGVFSQYRTQIMGIAAIMILICHIVGNGVTLPHFLSKIFSLGNYGVDIFMFVSGIGMFYSIDNNNMPLTLWYKKRLVRIFVPYLLISVPYCLTRTIFYDFTFTEIILNITTAEFWVLHRGAWFVSAILPLYLVTPVLYRKNSSNKERLIVALTVSTLMIVLSRISISDNALIHNIQFVLGRMPMFIIGYYIATNIRNKDCMQFKHILSIIMQAPKNLHC
jgi:peptidoglycan/LPS O-acetylase OafA/YrhL